ncbi:hypothetical protein [Sphingomonas sp. 1P08PE]|uniref:hypothetical protein n=1 Tax=Sphingomonas sp. 1P08PE TaxID=554122 RepID=UPI0039A396A8
MRVQAIQAVSDTLIDPQSAQFSDWKYYPLQKAACGRVNAKNRLGGYTGRSFFAFKAGELELADGDTLSELTVQNRCARFGLEEYNIEHAADRAARKERQAKRAAERAAKEKAEGGGVDAK